FLRRPDLSRDRVARLQVELADLRRRYINVIRARQVVVVGRAKETETVRQHLQHPFGEDEAALLGLCLQDLKDQVLLAHAGRARDVEVLCDLRELLDALVLQIGDVESLPATAVTAASPLAARLAGFASSLACTFAAVGARRRGGRSGCRIGGWLRRGL